jgi:hypothetical protein
MGAVMGNPVRHFRLRVYRMSSSVVIEALFGQVRVVWGVGGQMVFGR